jgi:hypothetical protein
MFLTEKEKENNKERKIVLIYEYSIEQCILDISVGKQLSEAATDV